ncbi:Pentatricopeptide repeat-containing protein [Acorus calamus]|uniref:Pentatricopeptide repeat-containing protein n=1 Tax=Acorus calamus TaxID=4465 RepID=A0AAV9EU57_ACOCL|nr:Pentatricopeptide repeat-containing protein [Acorus calamus]
MEPDAHVWGAILSGSGARADARTCEAAIARLVEVEPVKSAAGMCSCRMCMRRWVMGGGEVCERSHGGESDEEDAGV